MLTFKIFYNELNKDDIISLRLADGNKDAKII